MHWDRIVIRANLDIIRISSQRDTAWWLVRVLRCDVRHNVLQERGLLRFGDENERHRTLFRKPDYRDVIFLDVRNNLTAALRSSRKSSSA